MTQDTDLSNSPASLRNRIKQYREKIGSVDDYLQKNPYDWGKFQSLFNQEINSVFHEIMTFDKHYSGVNDEQKLYKLKRLFINQIRKYFVRGEYITWSLQKPYGYAGDHKIIDDIYKNEPKTIGADRLFDNYFQMSSISVAVRNRKDDYRKKLSALAQTAKSKPVTIMNLACGPCRDVADFYKLPEAKTLNASMYCIDQDPKALDYAANLLNGAGKITFIKESALRIALKKDITQMFPMKFDYIYCLGLYDYLDHRVAVRLTSNLKKLLTPDGILSIANVYDKYSNPSVYFMEWVGEWDLIYRSEDEFKKVFIDSEFNERQITAEYEQQGIIQYITARNGSQ